MAVKEWVTNYPTTQDADPITTSQPDLNDESSPGAGDGDETRSSQVEANRDKLHAVCKYVGDASNLPSGSLRDTADKVKISSGDTTFDYVENKFVAGSSVTLTKLSPGSNEQLQIALSASVTFDTKLPTLTYNNAQTINIAKSPGEPATSRHTLQDGAQRTFSGTLFWSFTNGVADLGLDIGTEQSSTWYYLYLIPSTADGNILSVRASVTDPATGPTGYTDWKYIGAFYNNSSSDILYFKHVGDTFYYGTERTVYYGSGAGFIEPETVYAEIVLTNFIPATATKMDWFSYADLAAETGGSWTISWSIDSYSQYFGHACRSDPDGATSHGQTVFPIPVTTNRSIWRKRGRGTGTNDIALIWYGVKSWTDGYLVG